MTANERDWDQAAGRFEAEVFNVLKHDRRGLIARAIHAARSRSAVASDIGCGVGRFLPLLARAFGRVHAVDLSERCLHVARHRCRRHPHVTFHKRDLARHHLALPPVDFCLCVNTLLLAPLRARRAMWDATARHIRPGGRWALVVPALESACLSDARLIDWNLRDGEAPARAARTAYFDRQPARGLSLAHGVVAIDGIPTKHYLKEELQVLLEERGFAMERIEKLEYPWSSEFTNPPRWMRAPYPWDWLVVARKRG